MDKASRLLPIATALATVFILAFLAWTCIDIYIDGNSASNLSEAGTHISPVFSREIAAERLRPMLPWLYVYAALIISTAILRSGAGAPEFALSMSAENRLRLMKAGMAELPAAARREEKRRRIIHVVTGLLLLICAVPCLLYFVRSENFSSWDLEEMMGRMLINTLPWVIAAFALVIAASSLCRLSMEREVEAIKASGVKRVGERGISLESGTGPVAAIRIILYLLAVLFIVLGVMNGGMRDVLVKAINICTECIGLG